MNIFDRYKAVQWLQKELEGQEDASALVDQLQETWQTLDALGEYLLPEAVISLILARVPNRTEEMTVHLNLEMDEFFALYGAVKTYNAELRQGDANSEMNKIALEAVQRLHQRILTATVQPPQSEEDA
jgi:hypothetical protein